MYRKGELKYSCPAPVAMKDSQEPYFQCPHDEEDHRVFQSSLGPSVFLPHSCNEWVIGGEAEVRALIEDLQEALIVFRG